MDSPMDRSQPDQQGELAARTARLRAAVRRLETVGGPVAERALADAAAALDAAATQVLGETTDQQTHPSDESRSFLQRPGAPKSEGVGVEHGGLVKSFVFPDLSAEGNQWVDGGSLASVFEDFLRELAGDLGLGQQPSALVVDVLSPVPRNRRLMIKADFDRPDNVNQSLCASIFDHTGEFARARGRWTAA